MGVFEHFPYTNFHQLNLDWIIRELEELKDVIGTQVVDIVARAGVAQNAEDIQNLTTTVTNKGTEIDAAVDAADDALQMATLNQVHTYVSAAGEYADIDLGNNTYIELNKPSDLVGKNIISIVLYNFSTANVPVMFVNTGNNISKFYVIGDMHSLITNPRIKFVYLD